MKYVSVLMIGLLLSMAAMADTLYMANVGGYSTGVGVGLGNGISTYGYTAAGVNVYTGYTGAVGGVSNGFTYPYSAGCCGCNRCDNCTFITNRPR